jgi:BlaI family transcriptional regulator, penicillinase repressor
VHLLGSIVREMSAKPSIAANGRALLARQFRPLAKKLACFPTTVGLRPTVVRHMPPKISSAEWDVMSVVWAKGPSTATEVFDALPSGHSWKQKTVNTFLTRLVGKGVLAADKREKAFVYTARLGREKYVRAESKSFLQRVFQGDTGDLMIHFCERADFTAEEIRELEQLLKARKTRK